ncbi:MAG: hypothetical protein ACLS9R_11940, partial [Anaerobutyricum hallii]|uniref:hypothetical protein n=1 Tax=Anaerobutyricum hallii TaxID=39488 RepID=UPI003991C4C5
SDKQFYFFNCLPKREHTTYTLLCDFSRGVLNDRSYALISNTCSEATEESIRSLCLLFFLLPFFFLHANQNIIGGDLRIFQKVETFKALDFEGLTFLNYRFDISSFSFCFEFTDFTGAKDSPKGRKYCLFVAWEQVLDASA